MAREVKSRLIPEYFEKGKEVILYYLNPCPTKKDTACLPSRKKPVPTEIALGINDIYPELVKHVDQIKAADDIPFYQTRFEYETCATANASMWGMSGGEIADMDIERSLAVSGMEETVSYLEKIVNSYREHSRTPWCGVIPISRGRSRDKRVDRRISEAVADSDHAAAFP